MIKLINKGGFRERANRSRKYGSSENQQTILNPTQYVPNKSEVINESVTLNENQTLSVKTDTSE